MKYFILFLLCLGYSPFVFSQDVCLLSDFPNNISIHDLYICNTNSTFPFKIRTLKKGVIHKKVNFRLPFPVHSDDGILDAIDFDDGQGFVSITELGGIHIVNYPTAGKKLIRQREQDDYGPGDIRELLELDVKEQTAPYEFPDEILSLDGGAGYIKLGTGNATLTKPLIFVEGLDFGTRTHYDPDNDNSIVRYGNAGWDVFSTGAGETVLPEGEEELFKNVPLQFQEFREAGFDLILLDFEDGADYIQDNAEVLKELINEVNELKQTDANGIRHENIVVGASMGGVIARIALAEMERDGQKHCTSTFVSLDVPYQGANIPLGIQALIWDNGTFFEEGNLRYQNEARQALWDGLNKPAPKQLLKENLLGAYQDGHLDFFIHESDSDVLFDFELFADLSIDHNALRDELLDQLETLGYPKQTRNIALVNGNANGQETGIETGGQLLDADAWFGDIAEMAFKAKIWSLNGGSYTDTDFDMTFDSDKTLYYSRRPIDFGFFGIPTNNVVIGMSLNNDLPSYDNAPGSIRKDIGNLIVPTIEATPGLDDEPVNWYFPHSTFIPTVSALDIDTDDLFFNVEAADVIANNLTPFDDIYYPPSYEQHVKTNDANRAWINSRLDGLTPDLASEGVLPNANGSTYNFGHIRRKIHSVNIEDGGIMQVNNLGPTAYLNEASTQKELFEAFTAGCGGDIVVTDGGRFEVGMSPSGGTIRKANVYITPTNSLYIKEGGVVKVENGSKLIFQKNTYNALQTGGFLQANFGAQIIIESGATLHVGSDAILRIMNSSDLIIEEGGELRIEKGAKIQLWGGQQPDGSTKIHVKGQLTVNGNFDYSGNGYFLFDNTNNLSFGPNVDKFILKGKGKGYRFIRLSEGTTLNFGDRKLILESGKVEYAPQSKIRIEEGGSAQLWGVDFQGLANSAGTGLSAYGATKIDIYYCGFYNLVWGISAGNESGGIFRINQSEFEGCKFSIWGSDYQNMSIFSSSFSPGSNPNAYSALTFINVNSALLSSSVVENYLLPSSSSEDYWGAIILSDVPFFRLQGGHIRNNDVGIFAGEDENGYTGSNIFAQYQATIEDNRVGIHVYKGANDGQYTGMVLMDCSNLINNEKGITGRDVLLQIDSYENCLECGDGPEIDIRPNKFIAKPWDGMFHYPIFDICYEDLPITEVPAKGNYWGGGLPDPDEYRIRSEFLGEQCYQGGSTILDPSNPITIEPTGCGTSDPGNDDGGTIGSPTFGGPSGKTCSFTIENTTYSLHEQYMQAYFDYRNESTELSTQKFIPIAAIPNNIRAELSGTCQHYIDVARVMVDVSTPPKDKADAKSDLSYVATYDHLWLAEAKSKTFDQQEVDEFDVFPNPANETIRLITEEGNYLLEVYDLLGKLVYSSKVVNNESISVASWDNGVFLLKLKDLETAKMKQQKLVVQK